MAASFTHAEMFGSTVRVAQRDVDNKGKEHNNCLVFPIEDLFRSSETRAEFLASVYACRTGLAPVNSSTKLCSKTERLIETIESL